MNTQGHGGGGHGGGHGGGARGGFGFPYVVPEPWVFEDEDPHKKRASGQELLSTGEGALLVLGLVWWLSHEADKRVPR